MKKSPKKKHESAEFSFSRRRVGRVSLAGVRNAVACGSPGAALEATGRLVAGLRSFFPSFSRSFFLFLAALLSEQCARATRQRKKAGAPGHAGLAVWPADWPEMWRS